MTTYCCLGCGQTFSAISDPAVTGHHRRVNGDLCGMVVQQPDEPTKEQTRACILCGCQTAGSVGAAGLRWRCICQACKDREDAALAARLDAQAHALDWLLNNAGRLP